jgi:DNA-binding beta-propeller fold protein YncE
MAIAVSPETNEILVADTGNARVQRFDTNGRVIGALGAAGSLQPPLTSPLAICCNKGGTVFVADSQANRLMRYDPVGRYIGQYGGARINQGRNFAPGLHLNTPQGITANAHSLLYVTMGTVTQGTIIVIDASSGDVVSEMDDPKRGLGFMSRPSGIAITEVGGVPSEDPMERESIYVSDTMNHRVLRFTWHITR